MSTVCTQRPRSRPLPHLRRARSVAWLGLVLLLLNAFSPALAQRLSSLPPSAILETTAEDLLQGRMVICTPSGLRVVMLDDDTQALPDDAKAREGTCPLCAPQTHPANAALPPLLAVLPPPPLPTGTSRPSTDAADTIVPQALSWRLAPLRGPPSAV